MNQSYSGDHYIYITGNLTFWPRWVRNGSWFEIKQGYVQIREVVFTVFLTGSVQFTTLFETPTNRNTYSWAVVWWHLSWESFSPSVLYCVHDFCVYFIYWYMDTNHLMLLLIYIYFFFFQVSKNYGGDYVALTVFTRRIKTSCDSRLHWSDKQMCLPKIPA